MEPGETSIADLTRACISQFEHCLSVESLTQEIIESLGNRLADVNLWADGVGAIAERNYSLDWRFKARLRDRGLVMSILRMLSRFMNEFESIVQNGGPVAGENPMDLDEAFRNIDSAIENLAIIGMAIRRTGKISRTRKADHSFKPDEHEELRRHLECIVLLRPSDDGSGLKSLDASELDNVQSRLIEANLRRRHRFLRAQKHSESLKGGATHTPVPDVESSLKIVTEGGSRHGVNEKLHAEPIPLASRPKPKHSSPGTVTGMSSASTAEGSLRYNKNKTSPAEPAKTQITSIAAKADYPRQPVTSGRTMFKCPCCCQSLRVGMDSKSWREHLIEDLYPYTCIVEHCPSPYVLFSTRKEWENHFQKDHPPQYQCPLCDDQQQIFQGIDEIKAHLKSDHADLTENSYPTLLSWSEVQVMGIRKCPLCKSFAPQDSPELIDHVFKCVHDFSLRALPWPRVINENLDKPVGTFTLPNDLDSERRIKWVTEIGSGSSAQESLQLSKYDLDRHSIPEAVIPADSFDYFDENDYFGEDAKDDSVKPQGEISIALTQNLEALEPASTSDPYDYSVGWICSLEVEYTAARLFLDEIHPPLPHFQSNSNAQYTVGQIGQLNVFIALVAFGALQTSTEDMMADMIRTFPNVKFVLNVGIGSGAPSLQRDIRLGDVIVDTPSGEKPSILKFEFGRETRDPRPQSVNLAKIPPVVLQAVKEVQAEYELERHGFKAIINNALEAHPDLRGSHMPPKHSIDRLYSTEYTHPDATGSCAEVCDPAHLINRSEEDHHGDVHFGQIGLTNTIIKHASLRDKLAEQNDVLCFTTADVELITYFPCLVIRGVCDYSDSHQNQEWQGYAAMTAAAYAKNVLQRISPYDVEARKMADNDMVRYSKKNHREEEDILEWLTPINYRPKFLEYLNLRLEGTNQWLLASPEYQTWISTDKQTLFCPGMIGSGKSIFTSTVIEDLSTRLHDVASDVGMAYIYCSCFREDEQRLENLVASLLKQLCQDISALPEGIRALYESHVKKRTRPSIEKMLEIVGSICALYSRVFIIIDALDECLDIGGSRATFLEAIFRLQDNHNVNIFATSRNLPNIATKFEGCISLEIRANEDDMRTYINRRAFDLRVPSFVRPDLQEEIHDAVTEYASGIFLLAKVCLDSLLDKATSDDVRSTIHDLDSECFMKYEAIYKTNLNRVQGQDSEYVKLSLQSLLWVTCAQRQLSTTELMHALAIRDGDSQPDEDGLPTIDDIVSGCAGLITVIVKRDGEVREEMEVVAFAHSSIRQYFKQTQIELFPHGHAEVAETCLAYLSFDAFQSGRCDTNEEFEQRLQFYPLYYYAACYWGYHTRESRERSPSLMKFLRDEDLVEASSQAMMTSEQFSRSENYSQNVPRGVTGLHLAASFGLEGAAQDLLNDSPPDVMDSYGQTPLIRAAHKGQEAVVRLLLEQEADIESRDNYGQTSLSWAAWGGKEAVVKLLLEQGADIESRDKNGQTPLSWAAWGGKEAVVKLLLDQGADIESRSNYGQTSLSWAAWGGQEAVVKLLLEQGADIESRNNEGRTPLSWAVEGGEEAVIKLLLEQGADIESRDKNGQTPLSWAAWGGKEAVVKLLLDQGADIESRSNNGQTPLSWAARRGEEAVVKLLLEQGADIESRDKNGQTPLSWAAWGGVEAVVKLLLNTGKADANSRDDNGKTPLMWATEYGNQGVIELLEAALSDQTAERQDDSAT